MDSKYRRKMLNRKRPCNRNRSKLWCYAPASSIRPWLSLSGTIYATICLLLFFVDPALAEVLAAGVPKPTGEVADYDAMFAELKANGVDVFMPFSMYQEVPEPKTLPYEVDFYWNLKRSDAARNAMVKHGVRLLIPGSILYANGVPEIAQVQKDPLIQTIQWFGRENIFGVYSFDEPAHQAVSNHKCAQLYTRVKKIDPSLPVVMVHASIPENCDSQQKVQHYLNSVKTSAQFADIVGFDVYAVPEPLMKVKSPYSGLNEFRRCDRTVSDYLQWLRTEVPNKKHVMILQAFCLKDQGHNALLAAAYGDRRPTKAELQSMVGEVHRGHATLGWWGQSLLKKKDGMQFWNDVLSVTKSSLQPR